MSLRRETRRLSRAFGALVLAATPLAAAQACSEVLPNSLEAPGTDATTTEAASDAPAADAVSPEDATLPPLDATCQVHTEILDAGPDVDPPCRYTLPCGLPAESAFVIRGCGFYLAQPEDGGDASLGCSIPESDGCKNDAYSPPASGSLSFECLDCLGGGGRRPTGLRRPSAVVARSGVAAYFARMAHDEAGSVHAFARLHEELLGHGAPHELVAAAARSVIDETRHARLMARRAQRLGTRAPAARVRRPKTRSLESIARENAMEGCIRETYGALLMHWQAAQASDPSLRRLFGRIAADETRHAALSWEVARWIEPQLDAPARARVGTARRRALRALSRTVQARTPKDFDRSVGQPSRDAAVALLEGMVEQLALG